MTTATFEPTAKAWECWECTALPPGHPDRVDCICKVHRPTHAIGVLLEPVPPDPTVQAVMLTVKLRLGREQVRAAREDAKFEERYDPAEAEKLRGDVRRWQLRVDRIEDDLRRALAEVRVAAVAVHTNAPAKKTTLAKQRGRKSKRAGRARAPKPPRLTGTGAPKGRSPVGSDGPGSNDQAPSSDPAPSDPDPDPERPAAVTRRTGVDPGAPLLERTRDFWQRRTSRRLSLEDAREIIENSVAYIRLLNTWAQKKTGAKPADPTLPGQTDTSADSGSSS